MDVLGINRPFILFKQMKILFHLGHPAHFHLFKNVISRLEEEGHQTHILIKEKDVLKSLLNHSGIAYQNILPEGKSVGKVGMVKDLYKRGRRIIRYCKENQPDLLMGTSADISYVGKYLTIPAVNVQEDDASVVPLHAWIAYPWATDILSPTSCDNGRWNDKSTKYEGYHELAYLHPDHFIPDKNIVARYTDPDQPFFLLRFASLNAHHDDGVRGLHDELAHQLINMIKPHGQVIITSERELSYDLEPYRLAIDPIDIHHLLAFAKVVIGDSQTMSAEAGVLGTPYIRYNDFVGKIGYLMELEEKYQLGFGITPDYPDQLLTKAEKLASGKDVSVIFEKRRRKMLSEKINVADFLYNYIVELLKK
jgi:uncharacterized protein